MNPVPNACRALFWGANEFGGCEQIWLVITDDNTLDNKEYCTRHLEMVRGTSSRKWTWRGEQHRTVTILYNNYPNGALDDTFNPDFSRRHADA